MFEKIKLGSCLTALVLFAFPWLDIQCSEKTLATQTGLQIITGQATPSEEMNDSGDKPDSEEPLAKSPLVAIALLTVVCGIVFSIIALFKGNKMAELMSSVLPAVALVCILLQIMVGFPVKNHLKDSLAEQSTDYSSTNDPYENFGNSMAAAMMSSIQVKIKPALYIQLFALGIPTLLLANSLIDLGRKRTLPRDPVA
jgi:hypothetical protein